MKANVASQTISVTVMTSSKLTTPKVELLKEELESFKEKLKTKQTIDKLSPFKEDLFICLL